MTYIQKVYLAIQRIEDNNYRNRAHENLAIGVHSRALNVLEADVRTIMDFSDSKDLRRIEQLISASAHRTAKIPTLNQEVLKW